MMFFREKVKLAPHKHNEGAAELLDARRVHVLLVEYTNSFDLWYADPTPSGDGGPMSIP